MTSLRELEAETKTGHPWLLLMESSLCETRPS